MVVLLPFYLENKMFIVQTSHGCSRTGFSYIAFATTDETELLMEDGTTCKIPAHETIAVLEVEEATRFQTREEAEHALDGLFDISSDADFAIVDNFGSIVTYEEAKRNFDNMVGLEGPFYNVVRNSPAIKALTSINQVVTLIDVTDTLLVLPRLTHADQETLIVKTLDTMRDVKYLKSALTNLGVTLKMDVPTHLSLDDKRHRLQEDLAIIFKLMLTHMVNGGVGPFVAEGCVGGGDTEENPPTLDILTLDLDTLTRIARWYIEADQPFFAVDLTKFNVQKSIINLIGYLQEYREGLPVAIHNPLDVLITAGDTRMLDIAEYVLAELGITPESYRRVNAFQQAYNMADSFISAKGIQFQNGSVHPSQLSAFHRWNAIGTIGTSI